MAFRLALAVGRFDVDGMLSQMSPEQLDEWIAAIDLIAPWGIHDTPETGRRVLTDEQAQAAAIARTRQWRPSEN